MMLKEFESWVHSRSGSHINNFEAWQAACEAMCKRLENADIGCVSDVRDFLESLKKEGKNGN